MAVDLTQFWNDTSTARLPLNSELLQQVEQIIGVQLPPDLLTLLWQRNGGQTRGFIYPMAHPTSWAQDYIPFDELFGILPPDETGFMSILDTPYLTEEWGLPESQVLLSGDGHWFITLDYRHGPEPRVTWIDTEIEEDIPVADSFSAFLAGLISRDKMPEED